MNVLSFKAPRVFTQGPTEGDRLRDQLAELKEHNGKLEGLVNFLEEDNVRLQDKLEAMMAAGERQTARRDHVPRRRVADVCVL